MTVGIAITNGLEAIVITDSRVSGSGRQSDSVDKMGEFEHNNYFGVIFGTGSANIIEGVHKNLNRAKRETFQGFASAVHKRYQNILEDNEKQYLDKKKREIKAQADFIHDSKERETYQKQKTYDLIRSLEQARNDPAGLTRFILAGYDKKQEKIRMFSIIPDSNVEVFINHMEIGSGTDGANLYLTKKLQGTEVSKLQSSDLAFFALNSYSDSTVNMGVGGTPKMAKITKDGCEIVPQDRTIVLINLSGAYLSEIPGSVFNHYTTRNRIDEVLNETNPRYDLIAKELNMSEENMKSLYIPYSSFQERANRMRFNN